jgi:hypothetical protein
MFSIHYTITTHSTLINCAMFAIVRFYIIPILTIYFLASSRNERPVAGPSSGRPQVTRRRSRESNPALPGTPCGRRLPRGTTNGHLRQVATCEFPFIGPIRRKLNFNEYADAISLWATAGCNLWPLQNVSVAVFQNSPMLNAFTIRHQWASHLKQSFSYSVIKIRITFVKRMSQSKNYWFRWLQTGILCKNIEYIFHIKCRYSKEEHILWKDCKLYFKDILRIFILSFMYYHVYPPYTTSLQSGVLCKNMKIFNIRACIMQILWRKTYFLNYCKLDIFQGFFNYPCIIPFIHPIQQWCRHNHSYQCHYNFIVFSFSH